MAVKYLIIGNGVAGTNAAKTLAQEGEAGNIAVYAAEPYHYYNRWQLPALLAGDKTLQDIYFYPASWYGEQGIQVVLENPVTAIDPHQRLVTLADGQQVGYEALLIATGGRAFIPPIQGADKPNVFVLRTVDDALRLRGLASPGKKALVIGGGLLGLEAAHSLVLLGLDVTVVEYYPRLLPRQLDAQGSTLFQQLFEQLGVSVSTGFGTKRILGNELATGVESVDGQSFPADLILISAGMRSNVDLAKAAGLQVGRGILINEWMQTSVPNVYAAGDCAEFGGMVYGIIPAAIEQAKGAALSMMGKATESYQGTTQLTSLKVAGIDLTCIGDLEAEEGCKFFRFEDKERGIYRKLIVRESRIIGSILLGDKANVVPISRLIRGGIDVSGYEHQLEEPEFDFRTLLAAHPTPEMARYECTICGHIYDPRQGDAEAGIAPNTPFEKLPSSWICPMCGATKDMYTRLAD